MTVQGVLPRNFQPMALRLETMSTVQSLKELLCEKLGQESLEPGSLRI